MTVQVLPPWKAALCWAPDHMPGSVPAAPGQLVLSDWDSMIPALHMSKLRHRVHCLPKATEFVPGKHRVLTWASLPPKTLVSADEWRRAPGALPRLCPTHGLSRSLPDQLCPLTSTCPAALPGANSRSGPVTPKSCGLPQVCPTCAWSRGREATQTQTVRASSCQAKSSSL